MGAFVEGCTGPIGIFDSGYGGLTILDGIRKLMPEYDYIYLGDNVEINMNCVFLDCNTITIGNRSGIGPGVHIYTVFHPTDPDERLSRESNFWRSRTAPVVVGSNVWIGGGSIILPGVTIGDGSTIGAGSVVTHDIPPRCVAVGNPCRVIRRL